MSSVPADLPYITICMAVLNESQHLESTIADVFRQEYPEDRFELVVADGGSTDGTVALVESLFRKYCRILLVHNGKRLASAGRNLCLRNGRGDIFVFLDGHCHLPSTRWLRDTADLLAATGADCLARPQPLDFPDNSPFQSAVAFCRQSRSGHQSKSLIYTTHEGFTSPVSHGAIYSRAVVDAVGLFDESFDACEDVEFNYRVEKAGFLTYMSPRLAVKYKPRMNHCALFGQVYRYGCGRARLIRKHPELSTVDMALAPAPAIAVASALGLVLASPSLLPLLCLLAATYAGLAIACGVFSRPRAMLRSLIHLPGVFFTVHCGFSVGFIAGLLPKQGSLRAFSPGPKPVPARDRVHAGEAQ